MSCNNKPAEAIKIDWDKFNDMIYGNWELASNQTHEIYGSTRDIIREKGEPERTQELTERNILFERTLEFLYKLTLMTPETFTVKSEEDKSAEDHLEDIKQMDNVMVFD